MRYWRGAARNIGELGLSQPVTSQIPEQTTQEAGMTKFAYSNVTNRIRQYDAAKPSQLPVPICDSVMNNVTSLAFTIDKGFVLCGGPYSTGHVEIRKVTGLTGPQKTEELVYLHPSQPPERNPVLKVRVRTVAGLAADRIYFSVGANLTPEWNPQRYEIYYLKPDSGGYTPVLYTTINPAYLTFLNPCSGLYDMYWYRGDFVFGDNDTLYLSTGPLGGCKVGVYQIDGAGPDAVTGTVQRIYEGDGPIEALCYESPGTLYFLRRSAGSSDVWKLDLSSKTETLVGQIPLDVYRADDLAEVGDAVLQGLWWWAFPSGLSKSLIAAARYVVRIAEALHIGKPTPHPDPRRTAAIER